MLFWEQYLILLSMIGLSSSRWYVNNTIFWNARFSSGFGYLPSMMATTGILGIVAIIFFLIIFLNYGRKAIFYEKNNADNALTAVSFLARLIFGHLSFCILRVSLFSRWYFISTGVFLVSLANNGKIGVAEISLSNKTKSGMIFMVIGIILLIGTVSSVLSLYS